MTAGQSKRGSKTKKTAHDLFGEAFKALGEHKYEKASTMFEKIVTDFPDEDEVLARAKTFQLACQRALEAKTRKVSRRSVEEHFDLGVFHHNNSNYAKAAEHFQKALKGAGENADFVHYAWAATKVQQGDLDEALKELKLAASIDPSNLCYASNDPDFKPLEGHEGFRELLGLKA